MNTKKQGDIGVGVVIAYYTSIGATVCIPLTDSQDYDLIIDEGNSAPKRVQVKRCTFKNKFGVHAVSLTVKGGNRTSVGKLKKLDISRIDILAISTPASLYIIPTSILTSTNSINLGKKYDHCKIAVAVS
jgi:PD-(D/E)XK endonuclease